MSHAKFEKDSSEPKKLPKRYFEDSKWLRENLTELTKKYPDYWIAILEKEVVIASKDLDQVKRVAYKKEAEVGVGQCVYTFIESFQRLRGSAGVRY